MLWQAGDTALAAYVLGGTLATLILFALAAFGLVRLLQRLRGRVGVAWRYGLANIARRPQASIAQVVAFGLGIMVMLLLSLVRADLLAEWRDSLPPRAPNHFLINIQPTQVPALRGFFEANGLAAPTFYPMIRGRLVAINDRAVEASDYADDRARRLVQREFNLSYAQAPQTANRVVAGRWWGPQETRALSVEQGLAQTLGLALGDTLTFRIAGEDIDGRITNLREVDWDSFQVNFFVIAPPALLADYPATFITSVYLPPADKALLGDMVKTFPNVTVIDVEAVMAKVRQVMDRVTLAMEYVFLFTLLAGLVVLAAAIQATRDERLRDGAILRTLGASRRQLLLGLAAEFVTLGLLAGVLAAAAASAIGYVLATQVFHFAYHANPWLWLVALLAGGAGIGLAGTVATAAIVRRPPLQTLRAL
jgi:putative ABC transport system permease protein